MKVVNGVFTFLAALVLASWTLEDAYANTNTIPFA